MGAMMKILFFGRLRELAGQREIELHLPEEVDTLFQLKLWLDQKYDLAGALNEPSVKTMLNQSLVHTDQNIAGDEEIGFLPPVGGG